MATKAIALMSGGLDSTIAVHMLHDMGIELIGAHFTGPFCQCNRGKGGCISYAKKTADELGIEFMTIPLGSKYIDMVKDPKHGYGSGVNPCMDCRIMMLGQAKKLMEEKGASFVMTGEVLGQRPMSQLKEKLEIIERESGLEGLILRPLCGQHMPETIPEKEGLVDRKKMLSIKGRRRREQMDLAEMMAVGDYPCPAGGCILTDKNFASRARDMMAHDGFELEDIGILKIGRHFRLRSAAKVVVGRDEEENNKLQVMAREDDIFLFPKTTMGPSAVLRTESPTEEDISIAAGIVASYCDGEGVIAIACGADADAEILEPEKVDRATWSELAV